MVGTPGGVSRGSCSSRVCPRATLRHDCSPGATEVTNALLRQPRGFEGRPGRGRGRTRPQGTRRTSPVQYPALAVRPPETETGPTRYAEPVASNPKLLPHTRGNWRQRRYWDTKGPATRHSGGSAPVVLVHGGAQRDGRGVATPTAQRLRGRRAGRGTTRTGPPSCHALSIAPTHAPPRQPRWSASGLGIGELRPPAHLPV
jgi:hypothetical protein